MRKIMTILFTCICVLALSACSGSKVQDDAIKDYQDVMYKTQAISSTHIDGKLLFSVDKEDMNIKISFNGDVIAQTKPQLAIEVSAAANGIRMDNLAKAYMKDNNIYVNVLDQQKMALPLDEKMLKGTINTKQKIDKDAVKKAFKNLTVTKEKDKKVLKGTFSDAMLIEMKKQAESTNANKVEVKNISMAEMELTSNKDNDLETIYMKLKATYHTNTDGLKDGKKTSSGKDIDMDIEATFQLSNHNNVKSITFPDFKSYKKTNKSKDIINQIEGDSL